MIPRPTFKGQSEWLTPRDGSAVWASNTTLTLNMPFTVSTRTLITSIIVHKADNTFLRLENGVGGCTIYSSAADVITVTGKGDVFTQNTDIEYFVSMVDVSPNRDATIDAIKTSIVNYDQGSKLLEVSPILSAAQSVTASMVALPSASPLEIPTAGYNYMGIWVKLTINNSLGIRLEALAKHTSAGTEEYNLPIETITSSVINITPEVVQFPDSNGLYLLKIKLDNVVPLIKLRVMANTVGTPTAGTIDTLYYTLGY